MSAHSLEANTPVVKEVFFPRHRWRLYTLLVIAGCLLVAVWVVRPMAAINGEGPAVGKLAPVIELVSICDGGRSGGLDVHMVAQSTAEGRPPFKVETLAFNRCEVCLVHFWGTWCGPCRDELPELAAVFDELRQHSDIQFVSISCASFDDPSLATLHSRTCQFYDAHDIRLPTYADPTQAVRSEFLRMMERSSMAYPTTILIDREGVIRSTWVGVPPGGAETIRKRVLKILNET